MSLFNRVAIIGVGLIGGSIALEIKNKRLAREIVGVGRHKRNLSLAKKIRAIDKGSQDLKIIKDADLVILATPVSSILNLAPQIARLIKPGCIVTDVGSTKKEIVSKLEKIFSRYVGSHPLAGSEKRGIDFARPGIFKNSFCVLTPTKKTEKQALAKVRKLWASLGARVVDMTPASHDKILSFVSHLPHIAAFSLIGAVPKECLSFAPGGLRDTTRIAASDTEIWSDIFLSNQKNIIKAIDLLQGNLTKIKSAIHNKNKKALTAFLREAKQKREIL
ncbi:MAG: prephenate dehydrogenase/arogenate dehydrogenase family protein [Candidatus Omnitrophica bacterium]|nr:prephenate dehydrogenase/arogenate dehydrogenase family protein [Candidatus Omnitrophota bacterium]